MALRGKMQPSPAGWTIRSHIWSPVTSREKAMESAVKQILLSSRRKGLLKQENFRLEVGADAGVTTGGLRVLHL